MSDEKILTQAAIVRGNFINHVSLIEKQIEIFISRYFCKDLERSAEMIEILIGDRFVSFESKRAAFENILKRHYSDTYKESKEYFEHLTIIQTQRNKLAHLIPYLGKEANERFKKDGAIGFVKFVFDKTKPVWFDKEELDILNKTVNSVKDWLPKLINNEAPS